MLRFIKQFFRILSYVVLLVLIVSFFLRDKTFGPRNLSSQSLHDPVQTLIKSPKQITVKKGDFTFKVDPLYDYDISGVVVSKKHYGDQSIISDKAAPYDLCMIWGDNAKNMVDQKGVTFSQNGRFCTYSFPQEVTFNQTQVSNNHLFLIDDNLLPTLSAVNTGEEVDITGKLVRLTGYKGQDAQSNFHWGTSTTRTDTGDGACELIMVSSITIARHSGLTVRDIFDYCIWLFAGLILLRVLLFFTTKKDDVDFSKVSN